MNIKNFIKKLAQTAPFVEPEQIEQVPVPQIPEQEIKLQPEPSPTPQMTIPVIPTSLSEPWKSKKSGKIYYFLNLKGIPQNTPLGAELIKLEYKFQRGGFSKSITLSNAGEIEGELKQLESQFNVSFDPTGIEAIKRQFSIGIINNEEEQTGDDTGKKIDLVINKAGDGTEIKELSTEIITNYLNDLVNSTDKAYQQETLQRFLEFSSQVYNYSWFNTMLIWFQNPQSSKVQSKTNWEKIGRKPKETIEVQNTETGEVEIKPNQPLTILRPDLTKKIYTSAVRIFIDKLNNYPFRNVDFNNHTGRSEFLEYSNINKYPYTEFLYSLVVRYEANTIDKMIAKATELYNVSDGKRWKNVYYDSAGPVRNFKDAPTWDVSQTEPIPGVPPEKVFDPDAVQWQSSQNTPDEYISSLTNIANQFAGKKGIFIDFEKDTGRAGGWSRGSQIAVNKMSNGLRQFSTVVHELAHSLLHFDENDFMIVGDRTAAETEAESTVYIVLRHFGFEELEFAANYLALHTKGETKKIFSSFENIQKAARQIIMGIETLLEKQKVASNWYYRIKCAGKNISIMEF